MKSMNHTVRGSEGKELWGAGAAENDLNCPVQEKKNPNNMKRAQIKQL